MFRKLVLIVFFLSIVRADSKDEKVTLDKKDLQKLLRRMETFEKVAKEQIDLVHSQQDKIEQLETEMRQQKSIDAVQAKQLTNLNKQCIAVTDIERRARYVRRQSYDTVAFSATLNQVNLEHIDVHQNIVFSDVITNVGNGYNNHHGLFVAPVSGLYMFTTTILSGQNEEFVASIEVNGSDVLRMFERGTDNRHGSATQTLIVQLKKGDDVSVQSLSVDHTYWGDKYSSFSGFLLQPFESPSQIVG